MNKAAYILYRRSGDFTWHLIVWSTCLAFQSHLRQADRLKQLDTGKLTDKSCESDIDDDGMDGHAVLKQHYHINAPLHTNKWSRNGVALFTRWDSII